ncbi:MAG: RNA polymerase sigma-70 factor [Mariniphaga sp.]
MNGDPELLKQIRQGNEESFAKAFDNYYTSLCYFADKFIHDLDESRSLVQQVFVDLWIKRDKLVIQHSLKSYLFKATKNSALDYLKHKLVETRYLNDIKPEEIMVERDLIEEAELNARINAAIGELPEKCREIFILCRFEELRYTEIALRLGISVKTVEMQMGIALKKLKLKLSVNQRIQILIYLFSKNNSSVLQGN